MENRVDIHHTSDGQALSRTDTSVWYSPMLATLRYDTNRRSPPLHVIVQSTGAQYTTLE